MRLCIEQESQIYHAKRQFSILSQNNYSMIVVLPFCIIIVQLCGMTVTVLTLTNCTKLKNDSKKNDSKMFFFKIACSQLLVPIIH